MKPLRINPAAPASPKKELVVADSNLTEMLQAVLQKGAPFRFRAAGSSMSPFIKNGDVLTVTPLAERPPATGDVIAGMHPYTKKTVVHRLIGRQNSGYRVKGDNTRGSGACLVIEDILGRVARVERNGKPVRGLGPERRLIALFSRWGLLLRLITFHLRLRQFLKLKTNP